MNAVASLIFPGSRTLAGWWRLLAARRPQAVWVGYLFLHRVESLARVQLPVRVEALTHSLLHAISLESVATPLLPRLQARLHLEPALLRRLLAALVADGLLLQTAEGDWRLTPAGQQALESGQYDRPHPERRVFHFATPLTPGADRPAHYLALNGTTTQPWTVDDSWTFDVATLRDCVARPTEWKERYGFPQELTEAVATVPEQGWQNVVVDRPERLLAVLIRVETPEGPQLQAFAARPDTWTLQAGAPAFTIRDSWHEAFPELAEEEAAHWRSAWQTWCQERDLPRDEAAACALEVVGERLRVAAPPEVLERLQAARGDALKGEAWLLVGDGAVRRALVLDLHAREV